MAEEVKDTQEQVKIKPSEQPENTPKTYSEQEYNALKTQLESLKQSAKESEDFKKNVMGRAKCKMGHAKCKY